KAHARTASQLAPAEMRATALDRLALETELRQALERSELDIFYQPQARGADGRGLGVGPLLRGRHPRRGLVLPDRFIGVAEDSRLIVPIGEWVLGAACLEVAAW